MEIRTSQQVERERIAKRNVSWELGKSTSFVNTLHRAKDLGWKNKEVQVRREIADGVNYFYIEPYEEGCGCKGILKYSDYFD